MRRLFGRSSSKRNQSQDKNKNTEQTAVNRQPMGNAAMAAQLKEKQKYLKKVPKGKYDINFAGMTNDEKLAELHKLAMYLDSKERAKDKEGDYEDYKATYDSVLQKATMDDEFLELLKNNTYSAAKNFRSIQYKGQDEFNKADEKKYGVPKNAEELVAANKRGILNNIKTVGYSDQGNQLVGYLRLLDNARDLAAYDNKGNKFRKATDINNAVMIGSEDEKFIKKVSYARGGLSSARYRESGIVLDDKKKFEKEYYQNVINNYVLPGTSKK